MKRQLDDYYSKFYERQTQRFRALEKDDYRLAKEIAQWKETVAAKWNDITVVSSEYSFPLSGGKAGQSYYLKVVVDEKGLDDAVGLEKVNVFVNKEGEKRIYSIEPLKMVGREGNNFVFEAKLAPHQAGAYKCSVRMYPKNKNLPHRQDFCYVKWLELPQM
jgi:starch phosphorylase